MDRETYQRECLLRNEHFLRDYLRLKQLAPPVFRLSATLPADEARRLRAALDALVPWGCRWLDPEKTTYAVVPQTTADLRAGWTALGYFPNKVDSVPIVAPEYTALLGVTHKGLSREAGVLAERWPGIKWGGGILAGEPEGWERASLLIAPPSFRLSELLASPWGTLRARFIAAPIHEARVLIPVYADTRREDIDWSEVARAQAALYGKKRRARDVYDQRLRVWDAYQEHRSFNRAAESLAMPVSTVKRHCFQAHVDIYRRRPSGRTAARRATGVTTDHLRTCGTCVRANREQELCAAARAYISQDHVAQREQPGGREPRRPRRPGKSRRRQPAE